MKKYRNYVTVPLGVGIVLGVILALLLSKC